MQRINAMTCTPILKEFVMSCVLVYRKLGVSRPYDDLPTMIPKNYRSNLFLYCMLKWLLEYQKDVGNIHYLGRKLSPYSTVVRVFDWLKSCHV